MNDYLVVLTIVTDTREENTLLRVAAGESERDVVARIVRGMYLADGWWIAKARVYPYADPVEVEVRAAPAWVVE